MNREVFAGTQCPPPPPYRLSTRSFSWTILFLNILNQLPPLFFFFFFFTFLYHIYDYFVLGRKCVYSIHSACMYFILFNFCIALHCPESMDTE